MKHLAIAFVRLYQLFVSPLFPPSCRFYPTCSEYILLAMRQYGFFKGTLKGIARLAKCHPFHPGGHDPLV